MVFLNFFNFLHVSLYSCAMCQKLTILTRGTTMKWHA